MFIHIDSKFSYFDSNAKIDQLQHEVKYSNVVVLPNRLSGQWGELSLVKIEIELYSYALQYARTHGIEYKIYHLLSGQDLPLHSQDYIHDFIDRHPNQEFLEFERLCGTSEKL